MKKAIVNLSILSLLTSPAAFAFNKVRDEATFLQAMTAANSDNTINTIVFKRNSHIVLTQPIIFQGGQPLTLIGNGATIDGSSAGSFVLDDDLTAVTEDGTLIFNTAENITIHRLSVINSATRGIVINIPDNAEGDDINVNLLNVNIANSALYGLHIDDNANEFDEGDEGSAIGIELNIFKSNFTGNGTGAIDFDGIRVDERGEGDIVAKIRNTHIDRNGGDGIELDEAGEGDVVAIMNRVTLNNNGFYNAEDLDDGFDIDEAGDGDIHVYLTGVQANDNMDEGLDFDEEGEGDVLLKAFNVKAMNNFDEGIKVDEEGDGDIKSRLTKVKVINSGDDGIQFTEVGEGKIRARLKKVIASGNEKYGIKIEQWFIEDEDSPVEKAGKVRARRVVLDNNGKGDEIKVNNILLK